MAICCFCFPCIGLLPWYNGSMRKPCLHCGDAIRHMHPCITLPSSICETKIHYCVLLSENHLLGENTKLFTSCILTPQFNLHQEELCESNIVTAMRMSLRMVKKVQLSSYEVAKALAKCSIPESTEPLQITVRQTQTHSVTRTYTYKFSSK